MKKLATVVLTRDIPEHGLLQGDVGVVADVWRGGELLEVEFGTATREPLALLALSQDDVRPVSPTEVYHVRELKKRAT